MSNRRKGIFFWSDLHVGHKNVLTFDNRPFDDLDHMHRVLINNYNSTLKDGDVCYFIGDSGLCKKETLKWFMDQLNPNTVKVCLLGNHDNGAYSMYDMGFDVVLNSAAFYIGKHRVSMSHCPLPGIFREDVTGMKGGKPGEMFHGESRNQMFMSFDSKADYHIHGHLHSNNIRTPIKYGNQYDIGVVGGKFRPISISEIEAWIANQEKLKNDKS